MVMYAKDIYGREIKKPPLMDYKQTVVFVVGVALGLILFEIGVYLIFHIYLEKIVIQGT